MIVGKFGGYVTVSVATDVCNHFDNVLGFYAENFGYFGSYRVGAGNTKVGFYGYFENDEGKKVPAPLVANVFEYGRSGLPFPKHPFLRKSFKKSEIEQAMLKVQKEKSGGLLE